MTCDKPLLFILKPNQVKCGVCGRPVRKTNTYEIYVKQMALIHGEPMYLLRKVKVCVKCKHKSEEHLDNRQKWELDPWA